VREIRSPGSVRGAARKSRPYRDIEIWGFVAVTHASRVPCVPADDRRGLDSNAQGLTRGEARITTRRGRQRAPKFSASSRLLLF
jgi:hypothetical protein